jgi:hypothetical protein
MPVVMRWSWKPTGTVAAWACSVAIVAEHSVKRKKPTFERK